MSASDDPLISASIRGCSPVFSRSAPPRRRGARRSPPPSRRSAAATDAGPHGRPPRHRVVEPARPPLHLADCALRSSPAGSANCRSAAPGAAAARGASAEPPACARTPADRRRDRPAPPPLLDFDQPLNRRRPDPRLAHRIGDRGLIVRQAAREFGADQFEDQVGPQAKISAVRPAPMRGPGLPVSTELGDQFE